MNPWYENLVARCYKEHDLKCEQGEDCQNRRGHVERVYVPTALRERVERAETRIKAVRDVLDRARDNFENVNDADVRQALDA